MVGKGVAPTGCLCVGGWKEGHGCAHTGFLSHLKTFLDLEEPFLDLEEGLGRLVLA